MPIASPQTHPLRYTNWSLWGISFPRELRRNWKFLVISALISRVAVGFPQFLGTEYKSYLQRWTKSLGQAAGPSSLNSVSIFWTPQHRQSLANRNRGKGSAKNVPADQQAQIGPSPHILIHLASLGTTTSQNAVWAFISHATTPASLHKGALVPTVIAVVFFPSPRTPSNNPFHVALKLPILMLYE